MITAESKIENALSALRLKIKESNERYRVKQNRGNHAGADWENYKTMVLEEALSAIEEELK